MGRRENWTWTPNDVAMVYDWSEDLPASYLTRMLVEINDYVGEHHGYDDAWDRLITGWRGTAEYWREHPDEAAALAQQPDEGQTACAYCGLHIAQGDGETDTWYAGDNSDTCAAHVMDLVVGFGPHVPAGDPTARQEQAQEAAAVTDRLQQTMLSATPRPNAWQRALTEIRRPWTVSQWIGWAVPTAVVYIGILLSGSNVSTADVLITLGIALGAALATIAAASFGSGFTRSLRKVREESKHGEP